MTHTRLPFCSGMIAPSQYMCTWSLAMTTGSDHVLPPSSERHTNCPSFCVSAYVMCAPTASRPPGSSTTRSGSIPGMPVFSGSLQVCPRSLLHQM